MRLCFAHAQPISKNWDSEETLKIKLTSFLFPTFCKTHDLWQWHSSHFGTDLLRHGKTIIVRRRWQACRHDGSLNSICPPSLYSAWVTPEWASAGTEEPLSRPAGRLLLLAASQLVHQWRHIEHLLNHIKKYTLIRKRKQCTWGTDVIWVSLSA